MFERAVQVVNDGHAERVLIRCAEPNETNFGHLKEVCADLKHEKVRIEPSQETFVEIGTRLAEWAEKERVAPPIFVMVDPFGVAGVPLALLKRLLKIERLEVLLTLMVRDPSRFLDEQNYVAPMTALFGGDVWRECIDSPNRPECLLLRFKDVVLNGVAKHAMPFTVYEDERKTILYDLVHLTNSDLGMREMKDAMVEKHGEMTFWPVTLRPPDQLELEISEGKPYATLQETLRKKYAGETMTFEQLLTRDYPSGDAWLTKHYRSAVKTMAEGDDPDAVIERKKPLTPTGKPAKGLELPDTVTFKKTSD